MEYEISNNSQYCSISNWEVPGPPRFERILLDPQTSVILHHARRMAQVVVRGRNTVNRYLEPHIAGFAFEELVFHLFRSISPKTVWDDTANHDLRVGEQTYEMKCRFSGNIPVEVARGRDFEVKVPHYNTQWQNPNYYVFGYCYIVPDGLWRFDVLGYRESSFVKRNDHFVARGGQLDRGGKISTPANSPSFLVGISELHPPEGLLRQLVNG